MLFVCICYVSRHCLLHCGVEFEFHWTFVGWGSHHCQVVGCCWFFRCTLAEEFVDARGVYFVVCLCHYLLSAWLLAKGWSAVVVVGGVLYICVFRCSTGGRCLLWSVLAGVVLGVVLLSVTL